MEFRINCRFIKPDCTCSLSHMQKKYLWFFKKQKVCMVIDELKKCSYRKDLYNLNKKSK